MNEKALSYIGLARRAGKLASGSWQTEEAVKKKTACLVLVASDASDPTRKKFEQMCSFYAVKCIRFSDRETLGRILGRGETVLAAFLDPGLAEAFLRAADL